MKALQRWLGLSVLGMFFFMVVVDGSIVTIAVPTMARVARWHSVSEFGDQRVFDHHQCAIVAIRSAR